MAAVGSLRRDSVGIWELVFQSMGQITPITILAGLIVSIVGFALAASPLVMVISFIAVLLAGNTVFQFSKLVSHAGGYYAYTGRSLGPHAGIFTGLIYVLYQTANLCLEFLIVIWGFTKSLDYAFGLSLPPWVGIVWMGSMAVLSLVLMLMGVKLSLRVSLVLGALQIILIAVISLFVIGRASDNSFATFQPLSAPGGWNGVFLGFVVGGYLAFAGYGSVVPMGEEARLPLKNIGRAVLLVILIAGIVFILGSYAMVVGYGISNISTFSSQVIPGLIVTKRFLGIAGAAFFIIVNTFFSTYGTVVGMGTPLTRVVYALSRDGVLPRKLSGTDARGTPRNSIIFSYGISMLISTLTGIAFWVSYGFYTGLFYAWAIFATVATLATLLVHILSNTG
ncbi:MAG TPA: amino acid permease, partial [Thermoplasmataceae archaeon]|nr:amino acid permease [Thermoplasmataceae archaeon]